MKSNHERETCPAVCPVCGVTHILRYGRHHTRCVCGAELSICRDWATGRLFLALPKARKVKHEQQD